jgi:hypothetical protein
VKSPEVANSGSGSFGALTSHSITESATPINVGDMSASIGSVRLGVIRQADTDLVGGNDLTITHPTLGAKRAHVHTVRHNSPVDSTLEADSELYALLSGRLDVPGVESGLPAAAVDMALQAAGNLRQTGPNARDSYWSLYGHSVGFDATGAIIRPTGVDRTLLNSGNILSSGGNPETVLYQEITGFCSPSDFTADGFPRRVVTDTVQFARERTYLKATVLPSAAESTTTLSLGFGPSSRAVATFNETAITLTLVTGASGSAQAAIRYHDASGIAQTVTGGTTSSLAGLSKSTGYTLTAEIMLTPAGALQLRFQIANDSFSSLVYTVTTPALVGASAILYSKQLVLSQDAAGAGLSDLVTRRAASDVFAAFAGRSYARPLSFVNQLSTSHGGSPIAPFNGDLWEYLKQIAAARRFEISLTSAGVALREVGAVAISAEMRSTFTTSVSDAVQARSVVITNQNTAALSGVSAQAFTAESIYSVDYNETKTFTIKVPEGVRFLYSPRPWYNPTATNAIVISLASYLDGAAELAAKTAGVYFITAQDGFPVSPLAWTDYGGRVTAAIVDGSAVITLTGPTTPIPEISGPFRIGEAAGSSDYAVLRLMGVGVSSNPVEVVLPSGGSPTKTRVEKSGTVTNVAVGSLAEVYEAAAWHARRVAGPTVSLRGVLPVAAAAGWGMMAGALVDFADMTFRIDEATISGGTVTVDGTSITRLSQMPQPTRSLATFASQHGATSINDMSIRPLRTPGT